MDVSMPNVDGLVATRMLVSEMPEVKVIILTASDDDAKLFDAIKAGAQGYLLKNLEADDFFSLLDRASRGEPALTPSLARKLLQEFAKPQESAAADNPDALTVREREVLELMVEGITSNRKMAKRLNVTENTVKFYVRNILDKLRLHTRAEAVGYALRNKIVDLHGS
jgi:DNA-binding NarL/FixJ family response regulator